MMIGFIDPVIRKLEMLGVEWQVLRSDYFTPGEISLLNPLS